MGDPIFDALKGYGWLAILLYFVVTQLWQLAQKYMPAIIRSRTKREEAEAEAKKILAERDADLRERQVIAMEQIGKSLVIQNEKLQQIQVQQNILSNQHLRALEALAIANNGITVLLMRKDRVEASQ